MAERLSVRLSVCLLAKLLIAKFQINRKKELYLPKLFPRAVCSGGRLIASRNRGEKEVTPAGLAR